MTFSGFKLIIGDNKKQCNVFAISVGLSFKFKLCRLGKFQAKFLWYINENNYAYEWICDFELFLA